MQQRCTGLRTHACHLDFVDVSLAQRVHHELRAASVGRHVDAANGVAHLIDDRRAIDVVVLVDEARHLVARRVAGGGLVDGRGERHRESILASLYRVRFKGNFPRPDETLQTKRCLPRCRPASARLPHVHRAVFSPDLAEHTRGESLTEGKNGALIHAVHFLEIHAIDLALPLIADEELAGKGTERATRRIHQDRRRRDAHDGVRKPNGGGLEMRHSLGDFEFRLSGVGNVGPGELHRRPRLARPLEARWVPHEIAALHMADATRSHPVALVLRVEQIALEVVAKARRRAKPGRNGGHLSIRRDLQHPAAPLHEAVAVAHPREIERNDHVPLRREHRAERVLVIVP